MRNSTLCGSLTGKLLSAILQFYSGERETLALEGKRMLALLDELDLLVLSMEYHAAEKDIATGWLATVLGSGKTIESGFLRQFQNCCSDPELYRQLERLIDQSR